MTKEQKLYRSLIRADIKIALANFESNDKAVRLQAAYHAQQAIEKTIKLKAELCGLNLWGHDIDALINKCDNAGLKIEIPSTIREKADMYTHWEAECRYYPIKVVRKDSIKKAIDTVQEWLSSGDTK